MKKMAKRLGVLTTAALLLAFAGQTYAFCVHNNSDGKINANQTSMNSSSWGFKRFSATLGPGDSACCNWQNTDCNKSGDPTAGVSFNIYPYGEGQMVCGNFEIPANGDLSVCGSGGNYRCVSGTSCN